ncbi:MAG: hypothetical protein MJY60_04055 [Bacteroidales bacterium]|nr:hypothetical protein [Bacteroidales bacterium]
MEAITLNPYQITWIEFIPTTGCVTKHDRKIFGDVLLLGNRTPTYFRHFPCKQAAKSFLGKLEGIALDKHYECRLFTDKQFSLAKNEGRRTIINYTQKQLDEAVII